MQLRHFKLRFQSQIDESSPFHPLRYLCALIKALLEPNCWRLDELVWPLQQAVKLCLSNGNALSLTTDDEVHGLIGLEPARDTHCGPQNPDSQSY